jgi:hypothetical protein
VGNRILLCHRVSIGGDQGAKSWSAVRPSRLQAIWPRLARRKDAGEHVLCIDARLGSGPDLGLLTVSGTS